MVVYFFEQLQLYFRTIALSQKDFRTIAFERLQFKWFYLPGQTITSKYKLFETNSNFSILGCESWRGCPCPVVDVDGSVPDREVEQLDQVEDRGRKDSQLHHHADLSLHLREEKNGNHSSGELSFTIFLLNIPCPTRQLTPLVEHPGVNVYCKYFLDWVLGIVKLFTAFCFLLRFFF